PPVKDSPSTSKPSTSQPSSGSSTLVSKVAGLQHAFPLLAPLYLPFVRLAARAIDDRIRVSRGSSPVRVANAFDDVALLQWLSDLLGQYTVGGAANAINTAVGAKKLQVNGKAGFDQAVRSFFQFQGGNFYALWQNAKSAISEQDVEQFLAGNPVTAGFLRRVTTNFIANIHELIDNLEHDFEMLAELFVDDRKELQDRIVRLTKLDLSGSDLHKGGKQVILLTFETREGKAKRLVYKPSDVMIDFCLVGRCDYMRKNSGKFSQLPFRPNSLMELLNTGIQEQFQLPTYRILPRKVGTLRAYGYIEFVTYDQYIDKAQARLFYSVFGQLLAIALTFGLRDFHLSNLIAHEGKPHLIDLEMAFGQVTSLTDTNLLGGDSAGTGFQVQHSGPYVVGWDDRSLFYLERKAGHIEQGKNRVFSDKTKELIEPKEYRDEILNGFEFMMRRLATDAVKIIKWFETMRISEVVVRHLINTADLAATLNNLRSMEQSFERLEASALEVADEERQKGPVSAETAIFTRNLVALKQGDLPSYYFRPGSKATLMDSDYRELRAPRTDALIPAPGSVENVRARLARLSNSDKLLREQIQKYRAEIRKQL
ncbi:DUF4135 domain-containing protein, partial [Corallococcus sp. CA047B]|uniref:DUF4135 domain-containing protein n=1 Tax=Corallococcus sp. CA047B TaxID=2316729 RepID=UPI000EA1CEFE